MGESVGPRWGGHKLTIFTQPGRFECHFEPRLNPGNKRGQRLIGNKLQPKLEIFSESGIKDWGREAANNITINDYSELRVLKSDRQTYSAQIEVKGKPLVLKIPRARNARPWHRFLSLFRRSEAVRHYYSMRKLQSLGFHCPEPVLAAEQRKNGFLLCSFLLYHYIEGDKPGAEHEKQIVSELLRLHSQGFLRRDPHAKNFLINGDQVIFIDFRLSRPLLFRQIRLHRELSAFLRTSPNALAYVPNHIQKSWAFLIGQTLDQVLTRYKHGRRRLRARLRNSGEKS